MVGPPAAEAAARLAVRRALADVPPGALVLVACSGGADSLALAAATAFVAPRLPGGVRAGAVVVDHGMQPGSDDVAARAAGACRGLGLGPVVVRAVAVRGGAGVGVGAGAGGPEAAARDARYAAFEAVAAETGAVAVLLGHTLDDQAESVLLGLARGSGARSLAGMAPRRGLVRRPFLGLRRADTEAVCRARALPWWDDPTNGAPVGQGGPATDGATHGGGGPAGALPLRSQVRTLVLPLLEDVLGPGVAPALARTADALRDDADVLDGLATDLLARARAAARTPPDGAGGGADGRAGGADGGAGRDVAAREGLDVAVLAAAPRALRTRALHRAARAAGSPGGALTSVHVAALDALVTAWHGQGPAHLPGPVVGVRECGTLVLRPGP